MVAVDRDDETLVTVDGESVMNVVDSAVDVPTGVTVMTVAFVGRVETVELLSLVTPV